MANLLPLQVNLWPTLMQTYVFYTIVAEHVARLLRISTGNVGLTGLQLANREAQPHGPARLVTAMATFSLSD